MQSNVDKIKEKVLLESLVNKDFESFKHVFNDVVDDKYNSLVNMRVNQQMGLANV